MIQRITQVLLLTTPAHIMAKDYASDAWSRQLSPQADMVNGFATYHCCL